MVKKVSAARAIAQLSSLAVEEAHGGQQVVFAGQLHHGFWGQGC